MLEAEKGVTKWGDGSKNVDDPERISHDVFEGKPKLIPGKLPRT